MEDKYAKNGICNGSSGGVLSLGASADRAAAMMGATPTELGVANVDRNRRSFAAAGVAGGSGGDKWLEHDSRADHARRFNDRPRRIVIAAITLCVVAVFPLADLSATRCGIRSQCGHPEVCLRG